MVALVALFGAACGDSDDDSSGPEAVDSPTSSPSASVPSQDLDGVVAIEGGRGLYVRCTGEGSPTVILEGGDGDDSGSYFFAEENLGAVTRTCAYDRANLGQSDPAEGPRGLDDLVGDLEQLLQNAEIPGPYVLVGTSGGGYITAGYAVTNKDEVAGLAFFDTFAPFKDPPREIIDATTWDHPENVEQRDYLQVEKDAWAARDEIGDIPVTVVSVEYSAAEIEESPFPSERSAMRRNVQDQKGWLVLSPRAEQVLVKTGHEVGEADPQLVIDVILDLVKAANEG